MDEIYFVITHYVQNANRHIGAIFEQGAKTIMRRGSPGEGGETVVRLGCMAGLPRPAWIPRSNPAHLTRLVSPASMSNRVALSRWRSTRGFIARLRNRKIGVVSFLFPSRGILRSDCWRLLKAEGVVQGLLIRRSPWLPPTALV